MYNTKTTGPSAHLPSAPLAAPRRCRRARPGLQARTTLDDDILPILSSPRMQIFSTFIELYCSRESVLSAAAHTHARREVRAPAAPGGEGGARQDGSGRGEPRSTAETSRTGGGALPRATSERADARPGCACVIVQTESPAAPHQHARAHALSVCDIARAGPLTASRRAPLLVCVCVFRYYYSRRHGDGHPDAPPPGGTRCLCSASDSFTMD